FIQLSIVPKGKVAATFTLSNDYRESVSDALGKREIRQRATTIDLLPTEYSLEQNYPNPFNPTTTISFALPQDGLTTLKVYDALGREVAELVNEFKPTGRYTASFDASRLSSGVYVYRLVSDKYSAVKKMLMLK
ncbi:MAG: T9SS type A sorting domain-containing protein, partial [Bacteroidetes bacterium]